MGRDVTGIHPVFQDKYARTARAANPTQQEEMESIWDALLAGVYPSTVTPAWATFYENELQKLLRHISRLADPKKPSKYRSIDSDWSGS